MSHALEFSLAVELSRHFQIAAKGRFEWSKGGGAIGILGPSGSGKSTFLRWLAGHDLRAESRLRWGHEEIQDWKPQLRRFGFLSHELALFPHLSVEQNITYGLRLWKPQDRQRQTESLLTSFEMSDLREQRPGSLSKGQQQRVALLRTLAPQPQLLLLDEPLSSLDSVTHQRTLHALAAWLKKTQTPTLLVTHQMAEASLLCSQIYTFEKGKLGREPRHTGSRA